MTMRRRALRGFLLFVAAAGIALLVFDRTTTIEGDHMVLGLWGAALTTVGLILFAVSGE